jgi:hypothetical protein
MVPVGHLGRNFQPNRFAADAPACQTLYPAGSQQSFKGPEEYLAIRLLHKKSINMLEEVSFS